MGGTILHVGYAGFYLLVALALAPKRFPFETGLTTATVVWGF
jgi:hypothetical protein